MGSGADTGGLTTVLGMLGAGAVPGGDGAEQDDLFEAPGPGPLPLPAEPVRTGQAGRPRGARNRSTAEWASFLLGRGRAPLTVLQDLYTRDVTELHELLQAQADKHKTWRETKEGGHWERVAINPLDVLKLQMQAATTVALYTNKRQPMAIEVEERRRGLVVLGSLDVTDLGPDDELSLPLAPVVENQSLSGADPTQSDAQKSDDATMSQQINGLAHDDS